MIRRFLMLVAAAVLTVPLAEELAFRGFLLRSIVSADVETVAYRSVTPLAILLSSVAFGLMHGRLWLAGIVAGAAYAFIAKRFHARCGPGCRTMRFRSLSDGSNCATKMHAPVSNKLIQATDQSTMMPLPNN